MLEVSQFLLQKKKIIQLAGYEVHFKPTLESVIVVCYTTKSVNRTDCCLSWFQQTTLHVAARQGDVNKVTSLADTGADTNIKDINGASNTILLDIDKYSVLLTQARLFIYMIHEVY